MVHSAILPQPLHGVREGQVWLLVNQLQQPRCLRLQRDRLLRPRRRGLTLPYPHAIPPTGSTSCANRKAHFAAARRERSFGNGRNYPRAKIIRSGVVRCFTPNQKRNRLQLKSAEKSQLDHNQFVRTGEICSRA